MLESEAREYRDRLVAILEAHGFRWIVEEIEGQVSEGKSTTKSILDHHFRLSIDTSFDAVRVFDSTTDAYPTKRSRKTRSTLITSTAYSESERLELLLDGILSAISTRANIEEFLAKTLGDIETFEYAPDISTEDANDTYRGTRHKFSRQEALSRNVVSERCKSAVANFRSEIIGGT